MPRSNDSFESSSRTPSRSPSSSRSSSPVTPRRLSGQAPVPVPVPVPAAAVPAAPSHVGGGGGGATAAAPSHPTPTAAFNAVPPSPKQRHPNDHSGAGAPPRFVDDRERIDSPTRRRPTPNPHGSDSDDDDDEDGEGHSDGDAEATTFTRNPDGSMTRILTADQFRKIFQQNIAKAQAYDGPPARPSSAAAGAQHQHPHHAPRRPPQHIKDFIDPYTGTKWRNRIVVPGTKKSPKRRPTPSQQQVPTSPPPAEVVRKKRASSKLREQVRHATAVAATPRTGGAGGGGGGGGGGGHTSLPTSDQLHLAQELMQLKHQMQLREKEHEATRIKLHKAQELQHKAETSMLRNRPEQEALTMQQYVDYLKGKTSVDAYRLAEMEETMLQLKQSSRAAKLGELQQTNGVYLAENRRLTAKVQELTALIKAGGESGQLQEAKHLLKQKETQVQGYQEKLFGAREDCRRAEAEAHKWRTTYEGERRDMDEHRRRVDDLRQAPVEITRLRRDLDDARGVIAQLQRQVVAAGSERSALQHQQAQQQQQAQQHSALASSATLDAVTRERDQLLQQLRDRERTAEAQRAEIARRSNELDREAETRALHRIESERALSRDREEQLRRQVHEWEVRYAELEALNVRLRDQQKDDLERQRLKEQQRQENMLATVGKYEKERMVDLQRGMEAREQQLQRHIAALEAEKAEWDAMRVHRTDELEKLKRQKAVQQQQSPPPGPVPTTPQQQQQAVPSTAPAAAAVAAPPPPPTAVPAAPAPAPSTKGPTISQSHQPSAGLLREMTVQPPQRPAVVNDTASSASSAPGNQSGLFAPPVVRTVAGSRPEAHTPTNVPAVGRKESQPEAPRYDKGDDTQSEITVKQGHDNTDGRTSPMTQGNESDSDSFHEASFQNVPRPQPMPPMATPQPTKAPPIPVSVVHAPPPPPSPTQQATQPKGPLVVQLVKPAGAGGAALKAASPQKGPPTAATASSPSFPPAAPIPAPPAVNVAMPQAPPSPAPPAPPQPVPVAVPVQQPVVAPVAVPVAVPVPQSLPQPLPVPQPLPASGVPASPIAPIPKPLPVPTGASGVPPPQPMVSPVPVPQPATAVASAAQRPLVPQPLPVPTAAPSSVPPPVPVATPVAVPVVAPLPVPASAIPQPPPPQKAPVAHQAIKKPPPKKVESTATPSSCTAESDDEELDFD